MTTMRFQSARATAADGCAMTRGKASRGTTARRVRAVVRASGRLERDVPSGEAVKTMKTAKAR